MPWVMRMIDLLFPSLFLGGLLTSLVVVVLVTAKRYGQAVGVAAVCVVTPMLLPFILMTFIPIDGDPIGVGVFFVETFVATVIATPLLCAVVLTLVGIIRERRESTTRDSGSAMNPDP